LLTDLQLPNESGTIEPHFVSSERIFTIANEQKAVNPNCELECSILGYARCIVVAGPNCESPTRHSDLLG
jgi:hypothetical protein